MGQVSMHLSAFVAGRDNNFNLIRMAAALAVLVTHAFALAIGTSEAEPFRDLLGMTIGSIAVDVFFLTSGFLVTASLLTRQSTIEFVWARVLRIFPALVAMVLLTSLGLGLAMTSLPASAYLSDTRTWTYVLKCATLVSGVDYTLPGVFEDNPYRGVVNGSLWTMPYEIAMYGVLVLLWICLRFLPALRARVLQIAVVGTALASGLLLVLHQLSVIDGDIQLFKLSFMFFSGATFYALREKIVLSPRVFLAASALLLLALVDSRVFVFAYAATVCYLLFFIAYVPAGWARRYNRLGDYSYGVYIYAFPVQQTTAALLPGVSVLLMVLVSACVTMMLAVASWHLLEKHAIRQRPWLVDRSRQWRSAMDWRTAADRRV